MQAPRNKEPEVDLKLPLSHVNLVLSSLGELPLKVSLPVVEGIQRQANASLALQAQQFAGSAKEADKPAKPVTKKPVPAAIKSGKPAAK